jgi:thioesterase domain-containing protein
LTRHIPADIPIYGLQARYILAPEAFPDRIEDVAAEYATLIARVQPVGPYNLLGWSLGGLIAQAIATHLQESGEAVFLLAMMDSYLGSENLPSMLQSEPDDRDVLASMIAHSDQRGGQVLASFDERHRAAIRKAMKQSVRLRETFSPKRFKGDILFFEATEGQTAHAIESWKPHVSGRIEVHPIRCAHASMMESRPLAEIGSILAVVLERHRGNGKSGR